jgi:CBS domain-containing protein
MESRQFSVADIGLLEPVFVLPDTPISECAKVMHDRGVDRLIVVSPDDEMGAGDQPIGVLTEHDIVVEVVAFALDPAVITAGDIMVFPVITARQDEALHLVHARMLISELPSIVIVDDRGALLGQLEAKRVLAALQARQINPKLPT